MHQFLSSIGFSSISKKEELDVLLEDVIQNPSNIVICENNDGTNFAELSREYGPYFGIAIRGDYDLNRKFRMEYFFPYFLGKGISVFDEASVEKYSEKNAYAGICSDVNDAMNVIFYLQNAVEYNNTIQDKTVIPVPNSCTFSGLSRKAMILLPIEKEDLSKKKKNGLSADRSSLIAAAKEGDETAIEQLALDDLDIYSSLSKRVENEDLYSIIESTFMPYGIEGDQYTIIGEIMDVGLYENTFTQEKVWTMTLQVNGMEFDICINKEDLLGEPKIGRRIKSVIWLQGTVNFPV